MRKGVGWNVGQGLLPATSSPTSFDLLPETGHRRPAFVNLQQYYLEECLVERVARAAGGRAPLAATRSSSVTPDDDGVGAARRDAGRRLLARLRLAHRRRRRAEPGAHAARARIRRPGVPRPLPHRRHPHALGFSDRALVLVRPAVPSEPVGAAAPAGRRRLAHRLPARLGRRPRGGEASRSASCRACARCSGPKAEFDIEWASVYTFQCRRMQQLPPRPRAVRRRRRAPRVARSARAAPTAASRTPTTSSGSSRSCSTATRPSGCSTPTTPSAIAAADENILNSTRATDFITPKSAMSRTFRDAVLALAQAPPVRAQARQQRPPVGAARLRRSPLNTPDAPTNVRAAHGARARRRPTRRCAAPGRTGSSTICSGGFALLAFGDAVPAGRRGGAGAGPRAVPRRAASAASAGGDGIALEDRAGLARASATMARPARATCSVPTSTSARAGARFDADAGARARSRARPRND